MHTDVWGIAPVISHEYYIYFVTFIDDFTRFTWVYFLRSKSEVFSVFKALLALVETQFSAKIKILQSDSGGEYMSNEFQFFLQSHGIISQRSCPFTPQQNGVAERKNRHLLDVVRTLLLESCVPSHFWCEALCLYDSSLFFYKTTFPSHLLLHTKSIWFITFLLQDHHWYGISLSLCWWYYPHWEWHWVDHQASTYVA